jgi:hypothetical protein
MIRVFSDREQLCDIRLPVPFSSHPWSERKIKARNCWTADGVPEALYSSSSGLPASLRDSHHRALSSAGELGRRSADRDVSGGHFSPPGRGNYGVGPSTMSNLNKKIYAMRDACFEIVF